MPDSNGFYFPPKRNDVLLLLLSGLVVNALSVALAWVVSTYLIAGAVCGDSVQGVCAAPFTLGYNIFLVIGALAATTWFVYGRIFRPALVTLPPVVMFWSLPMIFGGLLAQGLFIFALISTLLITFSYVVFYWLVRVSNFLAVLILWLAVVLGMRLFLIS